MRLSIIKTNFGSIHEDNGNLITTIQSFAGCAFSMTNNQIVVHFQDRDIALSLSKVVDRDPFFDTYTTAYLGYCCRILRVKENIRSMLGNTITFASMDGMGFAVHFDIN